MGRLLYVTIASLDGYVADRNGRFDWGMPDEEVHTYVNDLGRSVGTQLYGRRMYEVMTAWEDMPLEGEPESVRDWARLWRGTDKIVYSTTLRAPVTARTRVVSRFDAEEVRRLKDETATDLAIGGPTLAAHAFAAGLVDDCHLLLSPVVVGGGTRALPDGVRLDLELVGERRFGNGVVHLHHRVQH